MPRLVPADVGRRTARSATATPSRRAATVNGLSLVEAIPDLGVLALVGGDGGHLGRGLLGVVRLFLVPLERLDEVGD